MGKNIRDAFHRRLKKYVQKNGSTLSDFVRQAMGEELAQSEFYERLTKRLPTNLGVSAASLLAIERRKRDEALERFAYHSRESQTDY